MSWSMQTSNGATHSCVVYVVHYNVIGAKKCPYRVFVGLTASHRGKHDLKDCTLFCGGSLGRQL